MKTNINVFINCPLDKEYYILLKPMIFSLLYLGLQPKVSAALLDCAENRLEKILKLIKASKFSIHDISLMQAKEKNEFFRMNMPFELGIDYGIKKANAKKKHNQKKFLILERKQYHYKKALSDISGWDIEAHNNSPQKLIKIIRKWFVGIGASKFTGSDSEIWEMYNYSNDAVWEKMEKKGKRGKARNDMPINEYINFIKSWLRKEKKKNNYNI